MSWRMWGGRPRPPAFELGFDPVLGLSLVLKFGSTPGRSEAALTLDSKIKGNFKGVGQECPTHTSELMA
jgi:hypothetical protein